MKVTDLLPSGVGTFAGHYKGALPEVLGAVESAAFSEGFGYLVGKHHDWLDSGWRKKVPMPLVGGIILKAGAIAIDVMSRGRSSASIHLHAAGNAGMNLFFGMDGLSRGIAAANQQLYAGPKNPAKLPEGVHPVDHLWGQPSVNVGAIPQAPSGWADETTLRHFAQPQR